MYGYSLGRLDARSLGCPVAWSLGRWAARSLGRSAAYPLGRLVGRWVIRRNDTSPSSGLPPPRRAAGLREEWILPVSTKNIVVNDKYNLREPSPRHPAKNQECEGGCTGYGQPACPSVLSSARASDKNICVLFYGKLLNANTHVCQLRTSWYLRWTHFAITFDNTLQTKTPPRRPPKSANVCRNSA